MVLGYHVIFCMYGFWLPNDPRGSWSDFVGSWELLRYGHATKTDTRRSVAGKQHESKLRSAAKAALKYPAVSLNGEQARATGRGFADYAGRSGIAIWACSIMPEHVHLVAARHRFDVELVVNQLKGAATRQLAAEQIHPLASHAENPSCWARGEWKAFLNNSFEIERAILYVAQNPLKEGKPRQQWSMVTPYGEGGAPQRSPSGRG